MIGGVALALSLLFGISPCITYHLFGVPCPACGMTRAYVSLFSLEIGRAFFYHPLFLLVPGIPFVFVMPEKPRNIVSAVLIVILVGVWVARMILLFPHTAPMAYNEDSLLEVVRRLIGR